MVTGDKVLPGEHLVVGQFPNLDTVNLKLKSTFHLCELVYWSCVILELQPAVL